MYFSTRAKANYYDCDQGDLLKVSSVMKYMQQTSSEQLEALGFSTDRLLQENMVFLLSKMSLRIHRMPRCGESLLVGTAPVTPRGARFVREFIIDSAEGERLVSALSLWILVDPATRRILRPASFPYALRFEQEALAGIVEDAPLPKAQGAPIFEMDIPVRYSHIDVNRHINNTVYADFVCDALPWEELTTRGVASMSIHFLNEAQYGEMVSISTRRLSDCAFLVSGSHSGKPCFEAVVSLGESAL